MKVSVRYHEILEESLKEELVWLNEEFQILFQSEIENYTIRDNEMANDILDYVGYVLLADFKLFSCFFVRFFYCLPSK